MRKSCVLLLAAGLSLGACMKAPNPAGLGGETAAPPAPPEIAWTAPAGWTEAAIDQSFYLAKWEVAGGGVASLSWLGTGGGPEFIINNVQRWIAEWQTPEGTAVVDSTFQTLSLGGRKAHRLELGGTLTGTRQLGGGDPRADWRLFGAVIESEAGPLFLKFIGPSAVIERDREACWRALGEMRVLPGKAK